MRTQFLSNPNSILGQRNAVTKCQLSEELNSLFSYFLEQQGNFQLSTSLNHPGNLVELVYGRFDRFALYVYFSF